MHAVDALNASKSECCFFTLDRSESKLSPTIVIDGKVIAHTRLILDYWVSYWTAKLRSRTILIQS